MAQTVRSRTQRDGVNRTVSPTDLLLLPQKINLSAKRKETIMEFKNTDKKKVGSEAWLKRLHRYFHTHDKSVTFDHLKRWSKTHTWIVEKEGVAPIPKKLEMATPPNSSPKAMAKKTTPATTKTTKANAVETTTATKSPKATTLPTKTRTASTTTVSSKATSSKDIKSLESAPTTAVTTLARSTVSISTDAAVEELQSEMDSICLFEKSEGAESESELESDTWSQSEGEYDGDSEGEYDGDSEGESDDMESKGESEVVPKSQATVSDSKAAKSPEPAPAISTKNIKAPSTTFVSTKAAVEETEMESFCFSESGGEYDDVEPEEEPDNVASEEGSELLSHSESQSETGSEFESETEEDSDENPETVPHCRI